MTEMIRSIKSIDWVKTSQFLYLGLNVGVFFWIVFLITHTKDISYSSLIINYSLLSPIVVTLFLLNKRLLKD